MFLSILEQPPRPEPQVSSTPYPSSTIGAALVTVGVDEFYEEECYVWCRLVETDGDWEIEVGGFQANGDPPEWWESDIDEGQAGIGIQWLLVEEHACHGKVMNWALREGLTPDQEFLVYVPRPEWYRCNWEYEEMDFNCDCYIARKEAAEISLRTLERMICDVFDFYKWVEQCHKDREKARWAATDRMYLRWDYGGGFDCNYGYQNKWCAVKLCSSLADPDEPERKTFFNVLTSARSESNEEEEAMRKLAEEVAKKRPDLTLDILRNMKVYRGW